MKTNMKFLLTFICIAFVLSYIVFFKMEKIENLYIKDTTEIIIVDEDEEIVDSDSVIEICPDSECEDDSDNYYENSDILESAGLEVTSDSYVWKEVNSLDIFNNKLFDNKKIIAPGSHGTYEFSVKNNSSTNVSYIISFGENYDFFVNMKYRLKSNGKYVLGSSTEYVSINELILGETKILPNTSNNYSLEWIWASSDKDTIAGFNGGYYSLKLLIRATQE